MVQNFIGKEAAQDIIQEYLRRRGHIGSSNGTESFQSSNLQPYVKPSADAATTQTKKHARKKIQHLLLVRVPRVNQKLQNHNFLPREVQKRKEQRSFPSLRQQKVLLSSSRGNLVHAKHGNMTLSATAYHVAKLCVNKRARDPVVSVAHLS
jgi:hypothetical protein